MPTAEPYVWAICRFSRGRRLGVARKGRSSVLAGLVGVRVKLTLDFDGVVIWMLLVDGVRRVGSRAYNWEFIFDIFDELLDL